MPCASRGDDNVEFAKYQNLTIASFQRVDTSVSKTGLGSRFGNNDILDPAWGKAYHQYKPYLRRLVSLDGIT